MSDAKFAGLRALVTGGASGIGLATARLLAARGARVACLDVAAGPVEPPLELVRADVADDAAVRAAVQEAAGRLGGIDVLVNNAGVGAVGTVEANPDAEWHRVFDINVVGAVRVTPAALPWLRASGNAAVVNTCSVAATAGLPDRALYSATKGAAGAPASGRHRLPGQPAGRRHHRHRARRRRWDAGPAAASPARLLTAPGGQSSDRRSSANAPARSGSW